jgi:ketosteroid isomerase-like protein
VDAELLSQARAGLAGWQRGDLSALESLLDPDVELLWWEPGDWDCHGRGEVLSLLRKRVQEGAGKADVDLIEAGDNALVVARLEMVTEGPGANTRPATLVIFRDGKVVSMRQFRSREEALAACH